MTLDQQQLLIDLARMTNRLHDISRELPCLEKAINELQREYDSLIVMVGDFGKLLKPWGSK
jgi:hypothetical protein